MIVSNNIVPNKSLLNAALNFAVRQWSVFPVYGVRDQKCCCKQGEECQNPGKHPMTAKGLEEATCDSGKINKWWSNSPSANVGIRTGNASGVWVLDADGAEGLHAVAELETTYGKLPSTPRARTGGGGLHYYFTMTPGLVIKNATKLGGRPVDVRGEGGYVLAPPSSHVSGNEYVWDISPNNVPVAESPDWLIDLVTKKKWPTQAAPIGQPLPMPSAARRTFKIQEEANLTTAPPAKQGSRHADLLKLVGSHVTRGESKEAVLKAAQEWGSKCQPPMEHDEVERVVNDLSDKQAMTEESESTWDEPVAFDEHKLPSFPVQALPLWLRSFDEAEAVATQTPPDMVAMLSLSTVAATIAKKVEVVVKEGYCEPVNIFTVTALPPGNRKSAVFADVTAPLQKHEEAECQRLKPKLAEEQTKLEIKQKQHAKMKDDAAKSKPEEQGQMIRDAVGVAQDIAAFVIPSLPRLIASDATPEKLATLLQEQGGRLAVMSAEGDVFDLMAGRYGNKGAANFGVFLNGHAGDDLRVDRVNREAEFVKRPALTLGLAVQPDVIHGLADKPGFRERGLLGRFLYCLPKSLVGSRDIDPPPVPASTRQAYQDNLLALLRVGFNYDQNGVQQPHYIQLTPDAQKAYLEFAAWLEPQLAETAELGCIADWGAKLAGAVVRIAGILHMAENVAEQAPWAKPLQAETMNKAVQIGKYLIPHARAAFTFMGADPVVADAKFVLSWISRKGHTSFTERDAFEATKGRFHKVDALRPVLMVLVNQGYIRPARATAKSGPGRKPSISYEVNPHVLSQYSQNSQNDPTGTTAVNCANKNLNSANEVAEPESDEKTLQLAGCQNSANLANNAPSIPNLEEGLL